MRLDGIHHVTCITGDAPGNVDFYARVLGLRLVKKSVNQDELSVSDLFGRKGRQWLAGIELPAHEREQVESNLRLHDALDAELKLVDGQLAQRALADVEVRRLMTIPGVGPVTALSLLAVIGDITRFPSAGQLVGYLGLDPRVEVDVAGRVAGDARDVVDPVESHPGSSGWRGQGH